MTVNMNIWLTQKVTLKGLNISCIMADTKDLKDSKKDFVVASDKSKSRVKDTCIISSSSDNGSGRRDEALVMDFDSLY